MARAGRKRKIAKREPNGRVQRPAGDYRDIEKERVMAPMIEARARVYGLPIDRARDTKAETVIGRWCLQGEITQRQWEAAEMYLKDVRDYSRAIHAPKGARSALAASVPGYDGEESQYDIQRVVRAKKRYADVLTTLVGVDLDHPGCSAAVANVVLTGEDLRDLVGKVRLALNALANLYKIPEQSAKMG